jgi:uncharacterized protein YegJ (DUF2314 family)
METPMLVWMLMSLFVAWSAPSRAQSLIDRAARDEIARVKNGDPEMTAAIARARDGLDGFLARAEHPAGNQRNFSVKVKVPLGAVSEFLWLRPFSRDGERFVGRVVNQPRDIANLKYGDRLAFELKDIADWSYVEDGRMIGNYTACVLIAREPPEQRAAFLAKYGIDCDQ